MRRITRGPDFRKLGSKGKRLRTIDMDVRYVASPLGYLRVGIIVPLHGHSAVQRNKLKRRIRELVRKLISPICVSSDVVIRCRLSAYSRSFAELEPQIREIGATILRLQNMENSG